MKALTVRQPWASLIIAGAKDVEYRSRPTRFRGRVAITSSAKPVHDIGPSGVVLGTVEIVGCRLANDFEVAMMLSVFGLDIGGHYAWVLENPEPFADPIPCKGKLGIWEWAEAETQ